ncbi:YeeE/YedE family protein [Ferrimonas balearica]|nr:YeeE/YedE family protein [Ferrimonas balearica]
MKLLTAFLIGLIFGTGILIAGMGNPAKVLNFFDIAGTWDPSLIFVMGGALVVTIPGYLLVLGRPKPLFENGFQLPATKLIDKRLVLGSLTFGVGWGIAGFCPGGALPAMGTGRTEVLLFGVALIAGLLLARLLNRAITRPAGAARTV